MKIMMIMMIMMIGLMMMMIIMISHLVVSVVVGGCVVLDIHCKSTILTLDNDYDCSFLGSNSKGSNVMFDFVDIDVE